MKDEQFLIIYSEAVRQCYYNINCIYVRRRRTEEEPRYKTGKGCINAESTPK